MNVSIVIPNFNGSKLLEKNLPSMISALEAYTEGKTEIVISDDGSKDDSVEFLTEYIKKHKGTVTMQLIDNKVNRGFSVAVNAGVKKARGEIIILLNTDVRPHKEFLKPLITRFSDEKVFAVGCMDESIEEGEVVLRGRGIGKWERGFLHHSAGSLDKESTLWVSGGSAAFRKSIWDMLGGMNELYTPFYWEDIDLSYRAMKCGYKVLFEKKSVVVHEHSEGAIKKHFKPYNVLKTVYRNQFTFIWVNITDTNFLVAHIAWMPYHIVKSVMRGDKAFLVGFFWAFSRLPKVLAFKQSMRKLFVRTDREVIALAGK